MESRWILLESHSGCLACMFAVTFGLVSIRSDQVRRSSPDTKNMQESKLLADTYSLLYGPANETQPNLSATAVDQTKMLQLPRTGRRGNSQHGRGSTLLTAHSQSCKRSPLPTRFDIVHCGLRCAPTSIRACQVELSVPSSIIPPIHAMDKNFDRMKPRDSESRTYRTLPKLPSIHACCPDAPTPLILAHTSHTTLYPTVYSGACVGSPSARGRLMAYPARRPLSAPSVDSSRCIDDASQNVPQVPLRGTSALGKAVSEANHGPTPPCSYAPACPNTARGNTA
ncbi:hypothetical protein CFIO01_04565 [Colletotrichum fioriniae PJ7]|uniref:Uncharacterized protein n=1 Tax=Colletotrichum fioriniae PJ7 TaxID=1445577 RepID=A0A010R3L1_9PEZI|nr:hypothetical protein CFIO01_04565 [Colletotrichum fioriniae PJ7]